MRLNLQAWDSLALDAMAVDPGLVRQVDAVLDKHLGPARVRGVADLGMFWIRSGERKARPSRVLDIQYFPARRKVMCRLMFAPVGKTVAARGKELVRDVEQLTVEVLVAIEAKLGKRGIAVDLGKLAAALARDFAKLRARAPRARRSRP